MPPKPKFTREEIVAAALQVVRTRGLEALTTREIAAELGTSTRPIFTYFESMEQVRAEVRKAAEKIYLDTIEEGLSKPIPFLGVGSNTSALRGRSRSSTGCCSCCAPGWMKTAFPAC